MRMMVMSRLRLADRSLEPIINALMVRYRPRYIELRFSEHRLRQDRLHTVRSLKHERNDHLVLHQPARTSEPQYPGTHRNPSE